MERRSKAMAGHVNFPVDSLEYKNSGEGGMYVKLVILPNNKEELSVCCGTLNTYDFLSEVLVNDDKNYLSVPRSESYPTIEQLDLEQSEHERRQRKYFPCLQRKFEERDIYRTFLSTPLIASILLGSTGWSGYSEEKGEYWYCTLDDLTVAGKRLYATLQDLYEGHEIRLLTYLDT